MRRAQVDSSSIASLGYDPGRRLLEVEFHGGAVYVYRAVPSHVRAELMSAESLGRAFNELVRDRYAYLRVR